MEMPSDYDDTPSEAEGTPDPTDAESALVEQQRADLLAKKDVEIQVRQAQLNSPPGSTVPLRLGSAPEPIQ